MLESPFHLCSRITSLLSTNDYWWYVATSCEELTHWKRLWCWEGLGEGGKGGDRGWDGGMASLTRWTWVWVNSWRWWWTGSPGMLRSMGPQRVIHDWATELNWIPYLKEHYRTSTHPRVSMYTWTAISTLEPASSVQENPQLFSNKTETQQWILW